MKLDEAIARVRRLPRYRYRTLSPRHRLGRFISQAAIPSATQRQVKQGIAINNRDCHTEKIVWVEVAAIRSEQNCLRQDRLLWHLRHYAKMQREKKYPAIMMVGGVPILWDGNHRVTSAVLLGKTKIRCHVYFKKPRK